MTQEEEYIKRHNLDEIDSFLFKEFGIIGGACSAQMAFEYHTARMVAEKLWKKEEPVSEGLEEELSSWWKRHYERIDKNYDFNRHNGHYLDNSTIVEITRYFTNCQKQKTIGKAVDWLYQQQISVPNIDKFIEDFRKEMED